MLQILGLILIVPALISLVICFGFGLYYMLTDKDKIIRLGGLMMILFFIGILLIYAGR